MLLIGLAVGLEGGGPGQADAVRLERRHVEAGLKAARRSASREASSHFEQALGEHQRCLDLFPEASALAEGLGDRRRLARAATLAWRALPFLGQYRAAIDARAAGTRRGRGGDDGGGRPVPGDGSIGVAAAGRGGVVGSRLTSSR